jgi:membrane fusion protein (multidrug efflux system)
MSTAFSRAMRTLEADGFGRSLAGLLVTMILLGLWAAWFFLGRVDRFEVTDTARLEVERASTSLQAPMDGRVAAAHLALGKEVKAGDVLLELDAHAERLQLQEEQARLSSIPPQIDALRAEMRSAEQARRDEQQASIAALDQARAQQRESEATAQFAEQDAERLRRLRADGLIPYSRPGCHSLLAPWRNSVSGNPGNSPQKGAGTPTRFRCSQFHSDAVEGAAMRGDRRAAGR